MIIKKGQTLTHNSGYNKWFIQEIIDEDNIICIVDDTYTVTVTKSYLENNCYNENESIDEIEEITEEVTEEITEEEIDDIDIKILNNTNTENIDIIENVEIEELPLEQKKLNKK